MTTPAGVALVVCMCGRVVTEVRSADACACAPRITQPCEQCRNIVVRFGPLGDVKTARLLVMQTYDLAACKVIEDAVQIVLDFETGNRGADRGGELLDPNVLKQALAARRAKAAARDEMQGAFPCR